MSLRVVGIGEVLWDLLPSGPQLGGAPANFTYHARVLGAEARLVSRVGNDDWCRKAQARLVSLGIPLETVEVDPARPTGTVTVTVAPDGQPQFQIHADVAWDALRGELPGRAAVAGADVVCFGSLAQRSEPSRSTIRSLVSAAPKTALRIFDINLRQHYFSPDIVEQSLALAHVLKVNDGELPWLAQTFGFKGDERAQIAALTERFQLRLVAFTRGARGSLLFAQGRWSEHGGIKTRVVDTVGAGDAFSAAMALGLLRGWPLEEVNRRANEVAAYVCSQAGATPELSPELRAAFRER